VQNPLRLDAYNVPQSDLVRLRARDDDSRAGHPSAGDVLLLVEISDSSLAFDRGAKLALYARFGVPEVWTVVFLAQLSGFPTSLREGTDSLCEKKTSGALSLVFVPGVAIDIAAPFA
jgi:hypothetical protein